MIPESISYPKSRIVSISIFLSLVLHSFLFYVQIKLYQENKSFVSAPTSVLTAVKPMMIMMQPPLVKPKRQEHVSLPSVHMPSLSSAQMPLLSVMQPISEEQPAPERRRYRVGTGFDAPDTDKALALGQKIAEGRVGGQRAVAHKQVGTDLQVPVPLATEMPVPVAQRVPASSYGHQPSHVSSDALDALLEPVSSIAGRVPIRVIGADGATFEQQEVGDGDRTVEPVRRQAGAPAALSFLAPQQFQDRMRQQILAPDDEPIGGIGVPGVSGGVAQQRGDPKYLHYNSKVYTAIQQSMDFVMSQLSHAAYKAMLEEIKHAARVRFSLDADGKPHDVRISLSSGNARYDAIVIRIIEQASFPSIPRSFNFHMTYQDCGIILYDDGTPHERIGVSSYIEGE